MSGRRTHSKGPEPTGPASIRRYADEWLSAFSEDVQAECLRLFKDPSTQHLFGKAIGLFDLHKIAAAFDHAQHRGNWDLMPQRERDIWLDEFKDKTTELLGMMESAPTPPTAWGFPVRESVLMELLRAVGMDIPEPDSLAYWQLMGDMETKADTLGFTISNALRWYAQQQRDDAKPQQKLGRPRDKEAHIAQFIVTLCSDTDCTDATIASVAAVLFNNDKIDTKRVKRLRPKHVAAG